MKKIFLVAFAFISIVADAQIYKGQFMVGGNAGFQTSKGEDAPDDSRVTTVEFNPNVGYFFIDNLAGGLRLSLSSYKEKGEDEGFTSLLAAPFIRYYFLPAVQKVNLFADASFGAGSFGGDDKESFNQFSISAGPAVFLTPNTALEFGIGYRSQGGDAFGGEKRYNTIGLNIGFQIHLGGASSSSK
ncbi:MAG: outer membrane beta-barrel protein [Bacteroidota bacterium]|nr:outer membrane beta-barrel protein [Bacteroidota bacterium]